MSERWIFVIPTKPDFVPHERERTDARRLFEQFVYPPAFNDGLLHEITDVVTDEIEFLPGAGLDDVRCPRCGRSVLDRWWPATMDEGYRVHYRGFTAVVPCCGVPYALHDLVYVPPAAFSRYWLGALYPSIATLTPSQLDALADTLGCCVRLWWQRL